MAWVTAAIMAASAIAGYANKAKANRERKRLAETRPELEDSPYLDEQINLARSELARGQNTASRVAMEESADADFAASLDALLRGGGNVNNVSDLYDNSQGGRMRLAMMDDQLRADRIRTLMAAGQGSEQFRQQQFQFNQWAPWADNAQAAAQAYQQGNQQMWSGISGAASSVAYQQYLNQNRNGFGLGVQQNQNPQVPK